MSTDIVTVTPGKYAVFNHSADEVSKIIAANLGDTQLTEKNLPKVTFPSGGSTTWEIPGPFGAQPSKELTGILVHHKRVRAYWPSKKITGAPPACAAADNKTGIGNPGGSCRDCPMSQWGSAARIEGNKPDADGKACKEREIWFLLQENSALPLVISLPPASLSGAENYRIGYSTFLPTIPLESVQTTITLTQKAGEEGPFSVAVPAFAGQLTPEERALAADYAERWRPLFDAAAQAMATETPAGPGSKAADVDLDAPAAAPDSAAKAA